MDTLAQYMKDHEHLTLWTVTQTLLSKGYFIGDITAAFRRYMETK